MISDHAEEKGALSRIKIPLVWFIILAIALGLMVALMVPATFPDVNITRVSFADTYSKGERIEGLLLKPTDARELPMPAVVFSHGVIADKEIYLSLYRDLARRGFAVLAIDLPGHGGSGGKNDLGGSEYKAVLAAYDWLIANNADIDPSRVAAAGHSLGGVASTQAGLYQSRKKFSAVVAIWCWQSQESAMETVQGSPPRLAWKMWPLLIWSKQYDIRDQSALEARDIIAKVSPGKPPNYEVIVGNLDEGITVEQERELVARAAGLEDVQPGETYGSFEDGTARQLVVTHDDHVMEVFSTDVFSAMYNWLCKSFGIRPSGSAAVPLIRFSLWSWIFGLAFLLGLLLLAIIFRLLCKQLSSPVFLMLPGPLYAPQRQSQMAILSTLYFLVVSAVTLPLALALGIKVLVPFLVGDVVSSIAIVQVVLVLIGLAAGLFVYYGLAADYASIPWRQKAKNIGLALLPPLGGFGLLLALYALLARFLYLGPGLPFSWGLFILYVVLVTALFWAEGRYFHLFLLPLFGDDPRGKRKAFYIASEAAVRGVGTAFLFLPFIITEPLLIIGRPGFIRMPLLVAAFIISFPAYLILAWINLYFRKNRVSLILPSLAIVLVQAYFLTTLVCTR
jgi:pimeloyl-ACP methyl ester carboxylesterase